MHPINKKSFGPEGIKIKFVHDDSVLTGYIEKQTGASRYVAAVDGEGTSYYVVSLTNDPIIALQIGAESLDEGVDAEGLATIEAFTADDGNMFVARILSRTLITVEGEVFSWGFGDASEDVVKLDNHAPVDDEDDGEEDPVV